VLTRDNSLVQPLGSHRVDKADKASGAISKEFRDAQKAFQHERTCVNSAREQKFDAAIAAARRGIAEYPKSTLARICLANVMQSRRRRRTRCSSSRARCSRSIRAAARR
jgi:hypothetical protein